MQSGRDDPGQEQVEDEDEEQYEELEDRQVHAENEGGDREVEMGEVVRDIQDVEMGEVEHGIRDGEMRAMGVGEQGVDKRDIEGDGADKNPGEQAQSNKGKGVPSQEEIVLEKQDTAKGK